MKNVFGMTPVMVAVDSYGESQRDGDLKVLRLLAKRSDLRMKDNKGKDIFQRVLEEMDEETEKDIKMNILQVLREEMEQRMTGLLLLSKRENMEIPDDILMKISTLGLHSKGTEGHLQRKWSARSKIVL
jgi:hypothetical protein